MKAMAKKVLLGIAKVLNEVYFITLPFLALYNLGVWFKEFQRRS